jgi:hypothetical protein
LEAQVGESDPPDPAKIARDTRVLLQRGELTMSVAIGGLSAMLLALRAGYGMSGQALQPIEDLIKEFCSRDQEPSSG